MLEKRRKVSFRSQTKRLTMNSRKVSRAAPDQPEIPQYSNFTCQEKTRRTATKIQENELAHGKKIGPVDTQ